jgi:hypothetical protein
MTELSRYHASTIEEFCNTFRRMAGQASAARLFPSLYVQLPLLHA